MYCSICSSLFDSQVKFKYKNSKNLNPGRIFADLIDQVTDNTAL